MKARTVFIAGSFAPLVVVPFIICLAAGAASLICFAGAASCCLQSERED